MGFAIQPSDDLDDLRVDGPPPKSNECQEDPDHPRQNTIRKSHNTFSLLATNVESDCQSNQIIPAQLLTTFLANVLLSQINPCLEVFVISMDIAFNPVAITSRKVKLTADGLYSA